MVAQGFTKSHTVEIN